MKLSSEPVPMFKVEELKPASARMQFVRFECVCGYKGGATMGHYDLVSCGRCGKLWRALQPKRGGPFVAFPRPDSIVMERRAA